MENMELQTLEEKKRRLLSKEELEDKSREFYLMMEEANQSDHLGERRQMLLFRDLRILSKDTSIFERETDYLLFALNNDKCEAVVRLSERMGLNVHELTFTNGKSPLHWLVEHMCHDTHNDYEDDASSAIVYLLQTARENYRDAKGFSYFHGACQFGDVPLVRRFLDELRVDVDDHEYKFSPLYVAVEYGRVDAVRCLLMNYGANPNYSGWTRDWHVLHGLARQRRCDCSAICRPVDETHEHRRSAAVDETPKHRRSAAVDSIVDALVDRGARLDAPNHRGQTPLEWAVSRLDYDATRALLRHGASLDNLNENLSLSKKDYMEYQLSYYPVALYVPEMIGLLSRHGFVMNFNARLKFLKFWTMVRKYDMEDISRLVTRENEAIWKAWAVKDLRRMEYRLDLRDHFGFFIGEEAGNCLRYESRRLRREIRLNPKDDVGPELENIVRTLASIRVTETTTLLQICRMSYKNASPILTSQGNWRLPNLGDDEPIGRDIVKRHIANVLMRPQLELFANESFAMDPPLDHRRLGLRDVPDRTAVGFYDDEDLVRLCEAIIPLREQRNETSFIRISFYIFVIVLIIGITFIYINN